MPIVDAKTFKSAILNVAKWGDTDVFPFPAENHMLHDKADALADLMVQRSGDVERSISEFPVLNYSTLAPVGYTGFRWATQIDTAWNSYLLGVVLSLAPEIENERISAERKNVFSYRFAPSTNGDESIFTQDAWRSFQEQTRTLAEQHRFVVTVDIADFYSRVYHHRLDNALRAVDPGANRAKQIIRILSRLSNDTSYGLPVGGPAARILAELVLNSVDHLLLSERSTRNFCRYADDYRFFVDDLPAAYQALGFLSEKLLRNEGLSLQKAKTRIMSSSEYLSMLDPIDPPPGSAAKFLGLNVHYDPYSATAVEDYEQLKVQLDEFDVRGLLQKELEKGRVHTSLTRRLLGALRFMAPVPRKQTIFSLLENMETLAPVLPQVMLAARNAIEDVEDSEFTEQVHAAVRTLISESHYLARIDLNLAYMVRVLGTSRSIENEQLLIELYQSTHGFTNSASVLIQRDIMLMLANWRVRYWLGDVRHHYTTMHPWIKRSFILASYALDDAGRHWRDKIKGSLTGYDKILHEWAAEKNQQRDWRIPV